MGVLIIDKQAPLRVVAMGNHDRRVGAFVRAPTSPALRLAIAASWRRTCKSVETPTAVAGSKLVPPDFIMSTPNGAPVDTQAPGQADTSITKDGFKITTRKLPILKAGPIEEMTKKLGITPPEMIFGDNLVRIEHEQSGWFIEFNAFDALDLVDKTGEKMFKVSYSKEWQQNR
jgi:hypothetical protein